MGKLSQQLGKAGEERAIWFLSQIGAKCVEKIATPVKIVKGKAFYSTDSSVDFVAKIPCFCYSKKMYASRIEVKYRSDDRFPYSCLEPHQVKWLTEWDQHDYGEFYSFVLWVTKEMYCYLFPFPNIHFEPNTSLTKQQAKRISWFSECGQ